MRALLKTALLAGCGLLSMGISAQDAENAALQAIINKEREIHYAENPGTGPKDAPRKLAYEMRGESEADQRRRTQAWTALLAELDKIDLGTLNEADRLNAELMRYHLNSYLVFNKHDAWRMPLYADSGFHTAPARMYRNINFKLVEDYNAYLSQLEDLPNYLEENRQNLQKGLDENFTMPQVVLDGLLPTFDALVADNAESSSFYTPFKEMSRVLNEAEKNELRAKAKDIIENKVIAAYRDLAKYMREVYYPNATTEIAASKKTGGRAYYEDMVKFYTTVDISADEVHELGLREVERIRAEMEQIIKDVKFEGTFAEFLEFLRTDPQFYVKTPKELLMHASYYAKIIDGRMPAFFNKQPRQPYGVEAVPASLAPNYTTGRYVGAELDAPRGGYYWVNTYALDKRPLYTLAALTLHEGAPGHHTQTALSLELENVPEFRLGMYPHAYGEGWGLYSEKLGIEIGVYETPYDHFGRLSYEMWRACRLVVDTGMHAKGWTRAQAIKLLEENSALSKHNIRAEVDRYISWPGQALAYKMGELKILELRARATKALGDKFDVRDFHDQVMAAGGIPLYLLERRIDRWIAKATAE
ncbi:DUF885 domain-containing protein [Kordiimonas laminariae]|uniref:DUF885 domain-containing protein n=1 Tax=Kordiimonas laminariae TaxID=2917717 RepID=UPI001FF2A38E|nr:DUF885 domain-containing protein [Kordiimonas laminariae]MCK0069753.1 DUF885 domain-containing protein [Kordiimonas laminariae]